MSGMWKGMLVGLAGVIGTMVWAPRVDAAQCADLNNDGKITIADAVKLIQAVGGAPNPADCGGQGTLQCGDLDASGGLGVSDVVIILAQLSGNPTLFPLCQGAGNTIACSAGKATVSGSVSTTQVWSTACPIYVNGLTFVQPGVTVTIQPGATVVGQDPPTANGGPSNVSALIFLRGSKINAQGTPAAPIVMTSSHHFESNNGAPGDWGGLSLNGKAPVNCPGGECLAEGLNGVSFGGTNPNDSSGILEYVRVEFSGKELSPDNELNIITHNGVGRGTVEDHVQANVGFDDCLEWFGGTVDGKFMVASGCGDDLFDTQLGTIGRYQYYLGLYNNPWMQNLGNNGFEWDNNENGFDLLPRNAPKVCNVTLIGTQAQTNAINENTEQASNFRRGTAGVVANALLMNFRNSGIAVSDNATAASACVDSTHLKAGGLLFQHSLLFNNGNDTGGPLAFKGNWTTPCTVAQWWAQLPAVQPTTAASNGTNPNVPVIYGTGAGTQYTDLNQFIPAGGSPGVATEPLVNSLAMDCKAIDPTFFDTTSYVGAFRPGDPAANWLSSPWINFHIN